MSNKVSIHRFKTGVPGLDEILGGGLPEFSFNIITGAPGSGKTTLAHQMMFALAAPERPALFLTVLGEPPLKMLRYQQQFDFFDSDAINRAVYFVNLSEETMEGGLDSVLQRITAHVEARAPRFVFVDSFRSLALGLPSGGSEHKDFQQFVQRLGMVMTSWQATTFLIGEYIGSDNNPVFTVADGMICLQQSVQRNSMVRKMEIRKMRGQATVPGLHTYRISTSGIKVFVPPLVAVASGGTTTVPLPSRALTGVAALDDMLGGGVPRGNSLLVAGPSGAGKSILASAFLAEGARMGEIGVIAAFDQNPHRARHRVVAELIASGQVCEVDTQAPDLSIDEIVQEMLSQIRRAKATRVVIDSLSGFQLSVAPAFRDDFRESMSRMVTALAGAGVTVILTSELEDRYTDLRFSPYGTAFMTDAIIVMRYMEVESRLLRMLAVVKVRGSDHSNELRRYSIDDAGIQIGGMLTGLEGLLGGRPTQQDPCVRGSTGASP